MTDRTSTADLRVQPQAFVPPAAGLSPFAGMDAASLLASRAQQYGDRAFVIWAPFDAPERTWSYAGFLDDVRRLAGGLLARGIGPGDRVLVHLENCPETLLIRFACLWIGAVAVLSPSSATGPELRAMIETTGSRAAVTQPRLAALLAGHAPLTLEWIAVTRHDAGEAAGARSLPERAGRFEALLGPVAPQRAPDPGQPALILFTGGQGRAVLWTQENLLWAARLGAQQQGISRGDVAQIFLPLSQVAGFSWSFLPMLWVGGTILLQPRFSAAHFWLLAQRHHATISAQLPATLESLDALTVPGRHEFRFWIATRQAPEVEARFQLPGIVSAWGMTETVAQPILALPGEGAQAMGRPSPAYAIRIVDDGGRDVAPGAMGELLVGGVRGRSLFRDYVNDPPANAQAFTADGFFRTGDLVRQGEDGSIHFLDRIGDALVLGGEGVFAHQVETLLCQSPGVREAAVVTCPDARPDNRRGDIVAAFVVLEPGSAVEAARAALLDRCRRGLSRALVPQEIRFLEALPRHGFGAVSRGRLRGLLRGE